MTLSKSLLKKGEEVYSQKIFLNRGAYRLLEVLPLSKDDELNKDLKFTSIDSFEYKLVDGIATVLGDSLTGKSSKKDNSLYWTQKGRRIEIGFAKKEQATNNPNVLAFYPTITIKTEVGDIEKPIYKSESLKNTLKSIGSQFRKMVKADKKSDWEPETKSSYNEKKDSHIKTKLLEIKTKEKDKNLSKFNDLYQNLVKIGYHYNKTIKKSDEKESNIEYLADYNFLINKIDKYKNFKEFINWYSTLSQETKSHLFHEDNQWGEFLIDIYKRNQKEFNNNPKTAIKNIADRIDNNL